jgi:hypothetical protein
MPVHPLSLLVFFTFLLVLAFLVWNWLSVRRNQKTGGKASGIGGPNDPLS